MIDLVKNWSVTARRVKRSVIRELLKVISRPGMISFAGGLPDPGAFPMDVMEDICVGVIRDHGRDAFQYGQTEGIDLLKDELLKLLAADGIQGLTRDHLLVTVASQQGLDIIGRIFVDASDPILVETPSYLGGLQAFGSYGARMIGIPMDHEGIRTELLEDKLKELRQAEEHYKFVYVVPDFQNPSGITLNLERRRELVRLGCEYQCMIIEDSPYRQLRFEGEHMPSIQSLDRSGNVVSLFTFSKTFVPGLRIGWAVADPQIINKMVGVKQSLDLCTPAFNQFIAAEFCRRGLLEPHIEKVKKIYRAKRDAMLAALEKYMPDHPHLSWTRPAGGLFLWIQLPEQINADAMFMKAVENNVAYVVGSSFHCDGSGKNTLRMNFSYPTEEQIDEGVQRLATVIKQNL